MSHVQKNGHDYAEGFKGKKPNYVPPRSEHPRRHQPPQTTNLNKNGPKLDMVRGPEVVGDCSTRRNLVRIYLYLRKQHRQYMDAHFPPQRDYSKLQTKNSKQSGDITNPADDWVDYEYCPEDKDDESEKRRRVPYPEIFKRYFFRWVKTVTSKFRAKIDLKNPGYFDRFMFQKWRRLPQAFIIPAGPVRDKPWTANKKVVLYFKVSKGFDRPEPKQWWWRVFMRQDCKRRLRDIFMLQDEQENCTFEPKVARLTHQLKDKNIKAIVDKVYDKEVNHKTLVEDLGTNIAKKHPEIFKQGKLKKAKLLFQRSDYEGAMSTLLEGFKIKSLRNRFAPKVSEVKKQTKKVLASLMKGAKERREQSKDKVDLESIDKVKEEQDEWLKKHRTTDQ